MMRLFWPQVLTSVSCFIESVCAASDIIGTVRAHRAAFNQHLLGCDAVASRDMSRAWGDDKKGDDSCHPSVIPKATCGLPDQIKLVFGGWEKL